MKAYNYVSDTMPDTVGWKVRHLKAVRVWSIPSNNPLADATAHGIRAWCDYAKAHEARFESPIGQDYVLGPMWAQWGLALRGLLNGETGDLDCGTLDTIIYDNLKEQGFDPDTM